MWSSVSVVVHAWSRLVLYPTLLIVILVLQTAPALGWPRVRPMPLLMAWVLLVVVPTPGAQSLGEVDMLVLLIVAMIASELQPADWSVAAWAVMAGVLLAGACGTLIPARLGACMLTSYPQWVGYVGALGGLGWAWYGWPRQTLAQRMVLFALALLWSAIATAPWQVWWLAWPVSGVSVALTWVVLRRQTITQAEIV